MFVTRNVFLKYHSPETGGEGGSGGGGGDPAGDNPGSEGLGAEGGEGSKGAEGDQSKKPSDGEAKLIKEVMDKKKKLKAAEERVTALEQKLSQFDGIDAEAVRALVAEKREAETKQLEAKGEWNRLKTQMVEEHTREKTAILEGRKAIEQENQALKNTIAELTVGNAFAQSQFIQNELALTPNKTRVVYGGHFEFKDGQVIGYDKPTGAYERTPLVDAQGEPLAFEAALRKIVEADPDREQLLKSKMRQGANSKTAPKTSPVDLKTDENLAGKDKIAAALAKAALGK